MPMYLTRFRYTPETWARLVKNPEDRRNAARQYIESVGGTLHGFGTPSVITMATTCGRHRTTSRWRPRRSPSAQAEP